MCPVILSKAKELPTKGTSVILSKAKELRTQKKLKKMKQNGTIELEGMEFHSFHGCLESERREGNLFTVDFRACLDLGKAAATDSLEDTLDYGRIYDIVAGQMQIPSDLIENVAGRIISAISDEFPWLDDFSVRVSKRNPPVSGRAAWSRVTLRHSGTPCHLEPSCHPDIPCHPDTPCHPERSEGSVTENQSCHPEQSEGSAGK